MVVNLLTSINHVKNEELDGQVIEIKLKYKANVSEPKVGLKLIYAEGRKPNMPPLAMS